MTSQQHRILTLLEMGEDVDFTIIPSGLFKGELHPLFYLAVFLSWDFTSLSTQISAPFIIVMDFTLWTIAKVAQYTVT